MKELKQQEVANGTYQYNRLYADRRVLGMVHDPHAQVVGVSVMEPEEMTER